MKKTITYLAAALIGFSLAAPATAQSRAPKDMLNVSYDIARELFAAINPAFIEHWKEKTGDTVNVKQSHAGSSRQARAILEGLQADVVTFNQVVDVQILHDRGNLISADWQKKFPNNSSPFYSLPVFLVREGNPKNIQNWDDLAKDGVKIVFPNPKTSGNARYTYLAATAFAYEKFGGDGPEARAMVKKILSNVPVFDTGGRGATTTFVERGIGDVLITFEAEVQNIRSQYPGRGFEAVVPPMSLYAEFPVAVVEKVAEKRGSTELATEYLNFLYSEEAQTIVAQKFHRPYNEDVAKKFANQFPAVRLVTVEDVFGGWAKATEEHFAEGAILDQLFVNR